jgi:NitT/TauT family transport system substrate-binding protein
MKPQNFGPNCKRTHWLAAIFALVCCGFAISAHAEDKIRIGYIPITTMAGLFTSVDRGFFKEADIAPELVVVPGGPAILSAIEGGSLQIGYSSYMALCQAREQGFDFVIVAANDQENPHPGISAIMVLAQSDIKQARDLEGKRIGINALRNLNWVYAQVWMAKNGADSRKVQWTEVGFPEMGTALKARQLDAVFITEPFLTNEKDSGSFRVIGYPFAEADPTLPIAGWIASGRWAKANLPLAQRFAAALRKGNEYATQHPKERNETLAKYTKLQPSLLDRITLPIFPSEIDMTGLQQQADTALSYGILKQRLDVASLVLGTAK